MTKTAAIIGGGVIGGGWAARFLLMGWNVRVFDPDPEAERKITEVLENARAAMPGLSDRMLPDEGALSFCSSISSAVKGADWIQESVPERQELKRTLFQKIQAHCDDNAIIGSSTSGFMPSTLQKGATRGSQIVVTHPFNPVYLLPLVELVASPANPPDLVERAEETLRSIGMYPLKVRAEIDGHIADRLLEAVWREALWLVKDGIATTAEIDEAIRMGFGLRWAQMGLFETYRIAGGEAGMAQFLAQFGPCLKLPWTKLTDVPDLSEALIEKITSQSDEQSGAHSIRELERQRDTNLVAMMRALKWADWGAGAHLNIVDAAQPAPAWDISKPIRIIQRAVPLDWTDYNGHMTEARYLHAFAEATDRFMEFIGCDSDYIAAGQSFFTVETHIRHLDEVLAGAKIHIDTQCLVGKGKKMHLFHRMYEGDRLLATGEHMLLHVSLETRRSVLPTGAIKEKLEQIAQAHAALPWPDGAGRAVGQGAK
ncbi:carnitine 3-dehydrogenase [Actibacterium lipolyticum]|uniref:L-carnitine dehydrogenase n=1 Tax=Actibacterium lipolyticum TaxID=1524263 RepID=A0A238JRD3_9RHOB|nr:carnitine 3-dehydrogenase [Actibacterium lipolyticum]SMX33105.1 L-carnitine dehydrogenase [Actibacterium lipolyticum]